MKFGDFVEWGKVFVWDDEWEVYWGGWSRWEDGVFEFLVNGFIMLWGWVVVSFRGGEIEILVF